MIGKRRMQILYFGSHQCFPSPRNMTDTAMEPRSEDRAQLARVEADTALPPERRRVARILLGYADGQQPHEIARNNGVSESRARFWRRQFETHGMRVFEPDFSSETRKGKRHASKTAIPFMSRFTDDDLSYLRHMLSTTPDKETGKRIRIVLAYAEGKDTAEIASDIGLSQSRTRYWRKAFEQQGMELFRSFANAPNGSEAESDQGGSTAELRKKSKPAVSRSARGSSTLRRRGSPIAVTTGEVQVTTQAEKKERDHDGTAERQKNARLEPGNTFAEAARIILAKPFGDLRKQAKSKDLGKNPEIVHKMRVATRRMRSAFLLFDGAFEPRSVKPLAKGLKRLARYLGRVRDRDVLLHHMQLHASALDEEAQKAFHPLFEAWQDEHESHMTALRAHIASEQFEALIQKLSAFLSTPGVGDASEPTNAGGIPLRVGTLAPVLIGQRYADIIAFGPFLPMATLDLLHSLRIHCKKLRYTLEFFIDLLDPGADRLIRRVISMQDLLGHIQDAQTAGQLITTFVESLERRQLDITFVERINPAPLLHYLAVRQAEKHSALAAVEPAWRGLSGREFREELLRVLLDIPAHVSVSTRNSMR